MLAWILALCVVVVGAGTPAPPDPKKLLPRYTINLDKPPENRWTEAVLDHKNELKFIVGALKVVFNTERVTKLVAALKQGMPEEYLREMYGIAMAADIPYDDIIMANGFYEMTKFTKLTDRACTSIVAQKVNGSMYLGRNMDYPPPFSVLQIDAQFTRGGEAVYRGTVFTGTIGIITGVIPGQYALSIDARDNDEIPFDQMLAVAGSGGWIFHVITRAAFEAAASFDDAVAFFMSVPMIAPGYIIVGGAAMGQGAVVTANSSAVGNDLWELKDAYPRNSESWYILQTNWDHWQDDAETDGRRPAGIKTMDATGSEHIDMLGLWNTLASKPVYNANTINTVLVDIQTGEYRPYLRHNIVEEMSV